MMSFSVAHAVHERIRLQSYADASAYSMAVVEARAMNYIAYSNRAIAATFVSMATAHAYVAAANSAALVPGTGALAVAAAGALEAPMFHLGCLIQIAMMEVQYLMAAAQIGNMAAIEEPLNKAVENFVKMIQSIHKSQRSVVRQTSELLSQDILAKSGAPCVQVNGNHFQTLNKQQFACALESSPLDDACDNALSPISPVDERKRIMANVVNASRPVFTSGKSSWSHTVTAGECLPTACTLYHNNYAIRHLDGIPNPAGMVGYLDVSLEAYMADSTNCGTPNTQSRGNAMCARAGDQKMFIPLLIHTPAAALNPASSVIGSGDGSFRHTSRHSSQHNHDQAFKEMFGGNCDGNNTVCFINYRMGTQEKDWGQPRVFFVATQNLNSSAQENNCNENALPWHLNEQGRVSIEHGQRPQGVLHMRPQNHARAVSQAMVYFHRMDTWRAPPNLFEPYWRAKLHPFKDGDGIFGTLSGNPN